MSDVKRYQPPFIFSTQGHGRMHECAMGPWVSFDDYADLRARLEAVTQERDYAQDVADKDHARAERAEAALATARREALEEAAQFVHNHEVGLNPRTGYVIVPSQSAGTQGTHAGMAYATALRALAAQEGKGCPAPSHP